ncbi:MAG: hypothetical protein AAGK71_04185 [Pseudomonadota bacterium]
MSSGGETRVARRRVFYIPGYDPYPPRRYRELYRTESQRQAELSGYRIDQSSDPGGTGWTVIADIEGTSTESKIDILVWNDLVKHSMQVGIAKTYFQLLKTAWIYLSTGTLRRLSWLAKGPILAALYPTAMLLAQLLVAVSIASVMGRFVDGFADRGLTWLSERLDPSTPVSDILSGMLGHFVFWAVVLAVAVTILRWFRSQDNKLFAYYLMQDYAFTASDWGRYPSEVETRLIEFRGRIEDALEDGYDEVLIVGHSSGAQLAVSVVADVMRRRDPLLQTPVVSLLTLGQVIPMVSFLPEAHRLRSDLRHLSTCDRISWLDVSAPGDGCAFALSDPVAVSGVAPANGQLWPVVISAAFSQTLKPETLAQLKYRYFRLHFQYLCAFDQPGDYDYFRITAGPQTLGQRFAGRRSSKSRVARPASRYRSLEAVPE